MDPRAVSSRKRKLSDSAGAGGEFDGTLSRKRPEKDASTSSIDPVLLSKRLEAETAGDTGRINGITKDNYGAILVILMGACAVLLDLLISSAAQSREGSPVSSSYAASSRHSPETSQDQSDGSVPSPDYVEPESESRPTSEPKTSAAKPKNTTNAAPLICPGCSEKAAQGTSALRAHIELVHGRNWCLCKHPTCPYTVPNDGSLNFNLAIHYRHEHGERRLKCVEHERCKKRIYNEDEYRRHLELHKLRCTVCQDNGEMALPFQTAAALQEHMRLRHEGNFPCYGYDHVKDAPCKQIFTQDRARQRHMNNVHAGPFMCPHCPLLEAVGTLATYPTESVLAEHIQTSHPADFTPEWSAKIRATPTFPCPHCAKPFTRSNNLKKHISTVHELNRAFLCKSVDLSDQALMVDDAGEPLSWDFKTRGCDQRFANKKGLVEHVRSAHFRLKRWEALRRDLSKQPIGIAAAGSSAMAQKYEQKKGKKEKKKNKAANLLSGLIKVEESEDEYDDEME